MITTWNAGKKKKRTGCTKSKNVKSANVEYLRGGKDDAILRNSL